MSDEEFTEQELYVEAILRTMRQPLVVLNGRLEVERANDAFYSTFRVEPRQTEGRCIYDLGSRQWDIPALRLLLEDILSGGGEVTDFKVEHEFQEIGRRVMMLNANLMRRGDADDRVLLAIDDITERVREHEELEGQRELAQKIVDASRDPLLILGRDLRVRSANETFYDAFRVSRDQTEGELVYNLGNGQWNIPRLRELLENVLPDNDAFDGFVVEHEFMEIGRRTMVLNARRVDHIDLILLAIEDQTEVRQAATALIHSEERYHALIKAFDEGFCIIEMLFDEHDEPADYRFLEVNPAFVRHTGLTDPVGRRMLEMEPSHERHWFEIYGRIALTGEPARFERPARYLGDRWYDVYAFRIEPASARRVAIVFRDVADRKRAAAALHESEQRFRVLVESTAQAVWEAEPDGSAHSSPSWSRLTGQPPEETTGDGWLQALHPDDRERAMKDWRDCVAGERNLATEVRLRNAAGGWRWTRCDAAPIRDTDGRIIKWVGMNRDISRRKEAEDQRELLLGELNHRVKNVFAIIRALASQSDAARSTEEFRRVFLGRLDALVSAHALALASRWQSVDLATLAERTMRPYLGERPGTVDIDGPPLRLEPRLALSLSLVLHELATNAVKYGALSTSAGRVRLHWLVRDDTAQTVEFGWQESGGPPVARSDRQGFGTRLVERVFDYEMQGESKLDYGEDGLRIQAWFPLMT